MTMKAWTSTNMPRSPPIRIKAAKDDDAGHQPGLVAISIERYQPQRYNARAPRPDAMGAAHAERVGYRIPWLPHPRALNRLDHSTWPGLADMKRLARPPPLRVQARTVMASARVIDMPGRRQSFALAYSPARSNRQRQCRPAAGGESLIFNGDGHA